MKMALNDAELDEVTGGSVTMSAQLGMVRFTSIKKSFRLNPDVEFSTMRDYMLSLYDANADNMSESEFDTLVMNAFHAKGYI